MLPPAPGRLSITNCWPRASDSFCPTRRASTSVVPPGAKGTSNRTGLAGYACARTKLELASSARCSSNPSNRIPLVDLQTDVLHDLGVLLVVALDERRELLRAGEKGIEAAGGIH